MRNSVVLRLVSAAALALMAPVMSSPASAFVGLSDKQADEVSEFIKCKIYLLKWDLESFEADPDCGSSVPHVTQSLTYGDSNGKAPKPIEDEDDGEDCYPDYPSETFSINVAIDCPIEY